MEQVAQKGHGLSMKCYIGKLRAYVCYSVECCTW